MRVRSILLTVAILSSVFASAPARANEPTQMRALTMFGRGVTVLQPGVIFDIHYEQPGIEALLTQADGTPISGKAVIFEAGGFTVCVAITNAYGGAGCGFTDLMVAAAIVSRGYTATFTGDDVYDASSAAAGLV